jgi:hypothetical protein
MQLHPLIDKASVPAVYGYGAMSGMGQNQPFGPSLSQWRLLGAKRMRNESITSKTKPVIQTA